MSNPSTPSRKPPALRSPRTRQRSSRSSPSSTPPHSPALHSNHPSSQPHSPSAPHTTYQSFADLPPSPSTPHLLHGRFGRTPSDHDERTGADDEQQGGAKKYRGRKQHLTTADLVKMTVGLAGAQLCWTVEMAYGTPFLLSLGLTKQSTSLVWMAGPLSGLIVQPLVGALSDSSPSRYRRRRYIVLSTIWILLSTLTIAFAVPLSAVFCSILPGTEGDWDPRNEERRKQGAIWLGVLGFYGLDFALNGLQASLRSLVLDLSPPSQSSLSNAWLGRQTHLANILGYLLGYFDLGHSRLFSWLRFLGGGQFRKLALTSCVVLAACVGVTCVTQEEEEREEDGSRTEGAWKRCKSVVGEVVRNIRELPKPVKRVCYVQFFTWTAWFPFLFYATTYISEVFHASHPSSPFSPRPPAPPSAPPASPDVDPSTRLGSFALLLYAIISLIAGSLIPSLTTLAYTFPSLPRRVGPVGKALLVAITPRRCWTFALVWYAAATVSTFWVSSVKGATAVVAVCGVPWAITCWVPYALVMESIRSLSPSSSPSSSPSLSRSPISSPSLAHASSRKPSALPRDFRTPFRAHVGSLRQASFTVPANGSGDGGASSSGSTPRGSPARRGMDERSPLLLNGNGKLGEREEEVGAGEGGAERGNMAGGTLLGIHNLAIVMPQFFVALVASLIFRLTSTPSSSPSSLSPLFTTLSSPPSSSTSTGSVVWVLRFGGLFALLGAFVSVSKWGGLVETESERRYKEWVRWGAEEAEAERKEAEEAEEAEAERRRAEGEEA